MDSKALAKSKRAHSLHHTKRHHHPTRPSHADTTPLPSNWERYDDEPEEQALDVVLPKSNGADYRHLLEEALSHPVLPFNNQLLDSLTGEITKNMLNVMGERIVSWIEEDDFLAKDDRFSSGVEDSLFSLNLRALSDQLGKVDISRRLYIEPELLSANTDYVSLEKSVHHYDENDQPDVAKKESKIEDEPGYMKFKPAEQNFISQSSEVNIPIQTVDFTATEKNLLPEMGCSSKIGISTSEAELDALLNSFKEENVLDSSQNTFFNLVPAEFEKNKAANLEVSAERLDLNKNTRVMERRDGESHTSARRNIDGIDVEAELDALLNSSIDSTSGNPSYSLLKQPKVVQISIGSSRSGASDAIEKSANSSHGHEKMNLDANKPHLSAQTVPESVMMDDFDSWMDSL